MQRFSDKTLSCCWAISFVSAIRLSCNRTTCWIKQHPKQWSAFTWALNHEQSKPRGYLWRLCLPASWSSGIDKYDTDLACFVDVWGPNLLLVRPSQVDKGVVIEHATPAVYWGSPACLEGVLIPTAGRKCRNVSWHAVLGCQHHSIHPACISKPTRCLEPVHPF